MTTTPKGARRVALITGASAGLGRSLTTRLITDGWTVIGTARRADRLHELAAEIGPAFVPVPGDVSDAGHRAALLAAVEAQDRLDLLVNNASTLGVSPLPTVADLTPDVLARTFAVNVLGPHALIADLLPRLRQSDGTIINVSSDAAVEPYETWGGYGSSKAALDHLTAILGAEEAGVRVYAVDPGDMRTAMHQDAFPGEDIGDRALPDASVPGFVALVERRPPSGRYRARDLPVDRATGRALEEVAGP